MTPELPEYVTADEVATLLRVSTKRVYALALEDPTMPVLRLAGKGSVLRFPRAALLAWLAERTQGRRSITNRLRVARNSASELEARSG